MQSKSRYPKKNHKIQSVIARRVFEWSLIVKFLPQYLNRVKSHFGFTPRSKVWLVHIDDDVDKPQVFDLKVAFLLNSLQLFVIGGSYIW